MLEKRWVIVYLRKRLDQNAYKLSRECFLIFNFLYPLYYTTYNTAHAASRLWRYGSIYMNPSQAA